MSLAGVGYGRKSVWEVTCGTPRVGSQSPCVTPEWGFAWMRGWKGAAFVAGPLVFGVEKSGRDLGGSLQVSVRELKSQSMSCSP